MHGWSFLSCNHNASCQGLSRLLQDYRVQNAHTRSLSSDYLLLHDGEVDLYNGTLQVIHAFKVFVVSSAPSLRSRVSSTILRALH